MKSTTIPVIVTEGQSTHCPVHTKQAHHHDYPEIWAQGATITEAVNQLACHLERARESARIGWSQQAIERAIADVHAYLAILTEAKSDRESPC